jgi:UDP-N-acetylmuramoyl-tripeptide--D-alanyl-D-alanine ligase
MSTPAQLRGAPADGTSLGPLAELARWTGGRLLAGAPSLAVRGAALDTRAVQPGDLFCALRGERVDAHRLLDQAFAAGAAAAMVDRPSGEGWALTRVPAGRGVLAVPAVVPALARLAAAHLRRLDPGPQVVGVTGSVGKTSTRALTAAALAAGGAPVLMSEGNFNTEVSIPLVCLRAAAVHRFAVLELAMRGPGQIAYLAEVCRPTVAVLTVIGESHLELLGSVEAIARAKGELLRALPADGWAVLNADDPRQQPMASWTKAPVCWYGFGPGADVTAEDLAPGPAPDGGVTFTAVDRRRGRRARVRLGLVGRHQVANALAALAVAAWLGVPWDAAAEAMAAVPPEPGRLRPVAAGPLRVLDDTYNSAPASAEAALRTLAELAPEGRRAAILGDMLELGAVAPEAHRRVGRAAAAARLEWLLTVGPLAGDIAAGAVEAGMPATRVRRAADRAEAAALLPALLAGAPPGLTVLVKASRAVGLEEVVRALEAWGGAGAAPGA